MSFTNKQKKEYLWHHGNNCPYCGSKDIGYIGHEFDETIEIYVECYNCWSTWTELYALYDIQNEARGAKVWGKQDFQKGEVIMTRFGKARVLKTNPKTVKVLFLNVPENDWSQRADFSKVPYNELRANCKEVA